MTKIILSGCCGRMGRVIRDIVNDDENCEIVAGIDVIAAEAPFPVYLEAKQVKEEADVIIDFSSPKALDGLIELCTERQLPIVLSTTGFSPEQLEQINELSEKVAVFKSANMSLGINLMAKLLKEAAKQLANEGYDIEIVEKHHNRKVDAPSGTALLLADAINDACDNKYEYVYGRADRREARPANEIGISSVRGGTIVGEHEVLFAGLDEVIEIRHTAYSRSVFAKGAVTAAKFLAGKKPGMYNMNDAL